MPLSAYYEHGGLQASRVRLHSAIFSKLLKEGKPMNIKKLVHEVNCEVNPVQGRSPLPELKKEHNLRAAIGNEINQLRELGFLERARLGKIRIAPAIASQPELHKFVRKI